METHFYHKQFKWQAWGLLRGEEWEKSTWNKVCDLRGVSEGSSHAMTAPSAAAGGEDVDFI